MVRAPAPDVGCSEHVLEQPGRRLRRITATVAAGAAEHRRRRLGRARDRAGALAGRLLRAHVGVPGVALPPARTGSARTDLRSAVPQARASWLAARGARRSERLRRTCAADPARARAAAGRGAQSLCSPALRTALMGAAAQPLRAEPAEIPRQPVESLTPRPHCAGKTGR